jgi:translocation and assembly module TamB
MNPKVTRVARWIGKGLGIVVVSVVLIVGGALALLQTPWAQQHVARIASEQADKSIKGRVEVRLDGSLSLVGLSKVSVRLLPEDPSDAAPLAELSNVRAGWDLWGLVKSLVGSEPLFVGIDQVEVESLFVDLRTDDEGALALSKAVELAEPSEPQPESSGPSPYVNLERLDIYGVRILLPQSNAAVSTDDSLAVATQQLASIDRVSATFDMRNGMFATVGMSSIEAPIPGQPNIFYGDLAASGYMDDSDVATANVVVTGEVDGLPIRIDGAYDDERWVATVDAEGAPEAWRSAVPGLEPAVPLGLSVAAAGDLKQAVVGARLNAARSAITTNLDVTFSPLATSGALLVRDVDPQLFTAAAPAGRVNTAAQFEARTEPQSAKLHLELRESWIDGNPIPDFDLQARLLGERVDFQLNATDDSGLRLEGFVENRPDALSFEVNGRAEQLPEYPGSLSRGAFDVTDLTLSARGALRGPAQTMDASLDMYVDRVAVPSAAFVASDLSAQVTARGSLSAPAIDGNVVVHALRMGDVSAAHLKLHAASVFDRGEAKLARSELELTTRARLSKDATPRDVALRTTLASLSPLVARETALEVADDERKLSASVAEVRVGEGVSIEDVSVTGVGEVNGRVEMKGSAIDATLQTKELELDKLSQLFAPLLPRLMGQVTANVGLKAKGSRVASAYVYMRSRNVGVDDRAADEVEASLVVERDVLSGTVSAQRGESIVRLDVRDADLGRMRRAAAANMSSPDVLVENFRGYAVATVMAHSRDFPELEKAIGEVHVEGIAQSQVIVEQRDDLALRLSSMVKLRDVNVRQVEPRLPAPNDNPPDKAIDPELNKQEAGWEVNGLTADFTSVYDGASGELAMSLEASDQQRSSPILVASLTTKLLLEQLNDRLATAAENLPIEGSLTIPEATLDSLPGSSFLPTGVTASIGANVVFRGTVSSPHVSGALRVEDLQVSSTNQSFPVSLVLQAEASKQAVDAQFELTHDELVLIDGNVEGAPLTNDWRATARIDRLPLGRLPYVRDYGVTGVVSGDIAFDNEAANPSLVANIEAKDVRAYGETIPRAVLNAKLEAGKGQLVADVQQPSGRARLMAQATSKSGALADYRPTKVRLETRSFQIRPLLAALQESVSDLSGTLDGDVEVAFTGAATEATGEVELTDGLVLIPALGKQVHDIGLTLRAAPGKLELARLEAKVERGEIRGKGKLSYTPAGRLVAELNLDLPKNRRLPIANKGRNVAEASGRIDVTASAAVGEETKINVNVPELDVYFSDSATDKVMDSESPSFVSLGTYLPDGHYVRYTGAKDAIKAAKQTSAAVSKGTPAKSTNPTDNKQTRVTITLGRKVWLHHGTSTFAGVDGIIIADLGDATRLSGSLNLAEGRIDIQGRVFDIRPGTVVFHGESPPNPDVVAEAAWTSPSGYTVIATYRGSVTNGKVVLRSEPPLSYGEILNVLLFDDPEGSGGSDGSPGAGDVAATVASAGLSKSLTSLTDLDVQASMDTDAAGSPRPELGIRISPRLAVQVAYVLDPSAALSQPPDRAFVSFDWRLSNSWTLETALGDHGSAATDVTWKYRY